jgi:hypothetical protein
MLPLTAMQPSLDAGKPMEFDAVFRCILELATR